MIVLTIVKTINYSLWSIY